MITRNQMIINNLLIILKIIKVAQQKQRLARQHEQRLNDLRTQLGGWNSYYYYYKVAAPRGYHYLATFFSI